MRTAACETATAPAHSRGRELGFAGVLLMAMLVGTFPQYALGVLAPILTVELSIAEFELGAVASLLYLSAATVARLIGRRIDGMSGRLALGLLFCTSIGSLLLLAASRSLLWLVATVLLAGVAIGANNPVTNRLIAVHIPPGRRGLFIGVKQTGVKFAHMASGAVIPLFALTLGWRAGLVLFAAIALLIILGALPVVPRDPVTAPTAAPPKTTRRLRDRVRWLRYYAAFMAIGMSAITTYLPLYAVQNVGMSLAQGGLVVTAMGLTAVIARLVWATIADRGARPTGVLLTLSAGGGVGLVAISGAEAVGPWLLWVAAVWVGATVGSWNVVAHLTVVSEIETGQAAAATGLVQATFLLGLAVGAPVFGLVVEATGSFQAGWLVTGALTIAAFIVARRERTRHTTVETARASAQNWTGAG